MSSTGFVVSLSLSVGFLFEVASLSVGVGSCPCPCLDCWLQLLSIGSDLLESEGVGLSCVC